MTGEETCEYIKSVFQDLEVCHMQEGEKEWLNLGGSRKQLRLRG